MVLIKMRSDGFGIVAIPFLTVTDEQIEPCAA